MTLKPGLTGQLFVWTCGSTARKATTSDYFQLTYYLPITFSSNQIFIWFIKCHKIVKNVHSKLPEPVLVFDMSRFVRIESKDLMVKILKIICLLQS